MGDLHADLMHRILAVLLKSIFRKNARRYEKIKSGPKRIFPLDLKANSNIPGEHRLIESLRRWTFE